MDWVTVVWESVEAVSAAWSETIELADSSDTMVESSCRPFVGGRLRGQGFVGVASVSGLKADDSGEEEPEEELWCSRGCGSASSLK